ncbi:glycosyltransferase family 2 protein [Tateyamaria sp. ANG-S1]|uniref:glycosyltransferase family 2 protein n=1 Tax=Tateyamaria sp. ANG-S1 TaxID=1577905 RepID=UPI00187CC54C|nr:glycosyltransferase family 2 protein [Tateyamaria sp. ANG-S1]
MHTTASEQVAQAPLVSVIMSNFNGSRYLEAAVTSVLSQSYQNLELIVADDASEDNSLTILKRLACSDHRLKLIAKDTNAGPAGARNSALDAARGTWVAFVDADDLLHPQRIERLLTAANALGADVIADDLVSFGSVPLAGRTLLEGRYLTDCLQLTAAELVRSDSVTSGLGSFGYLKPMIHRDTLGALRYDETLRIGEDFDLYARLLLADAKFFVIPAPLYLYRQHEKSISNRLSVPVLLGLLTAHQRLSADADRFQRNNSDLRQALRARGATLDRALRYQKLVDAIKAYKVFEAAGRVLSNPVLIGDLATSLLDRRRRERLANKMDRRASPQTIVLAEANIVEQISAPAGALRIAVAGQDNPDGDWGAHRALASRLARLTTEAQSDIIAHGAPGLDALGYIPLWTSARVRLDIKTAERATVPPGAEVALLDDRS